MTRDTFSESTRPLVTDLDGTLIRADLLSEGVLQILRQRPWRLPGLLFALLRGRAALKARVAREAEIDPASLPWNETVVEFLRAEHARGRPIWLATASHRSLADIVAGHLGLFDRVIATTDHDNVKGARKRAVLLDEAPDGFDYIGDSDADMPLFAAARRAWTVGPYAERLARRAGAGGGAVEPLPGAAPVRSSVAALVHLVRPHQWLKNGLVFLPVVAGHRWAESGVVLHTVAVFVAFCLIASSAYVLNDLLDVEYDRVHPRKRHRPIASGSVPQLLAWSLFPALLLAGGAVSLLLSSRVAVVLLGYFILTTLYSIVLKRIALLDILTLTVLYSTRILAGGVATGIHLSYWLIGFALFLFFALAVMKRVTEVRALGASGKTVAAGRGYRTGDEQLLLPLGIACSVTAAVVFGLYTTSPDVHQLYSRPSSLLLVVPLILFWQCSLWLATIRDRMHDDPLVFAVRDPVTWVVVAAAAVLFVAAL
ncbi:MAG: UbiA family prenyltransferase [Arenicellales bacterium]